MKINILGIDADQSLRLRAALLAGQEMLKPGFVRLNFSVLLSDEEVAFILDAVAELAGDAPRYEPRYDFDPARAIYFPRAALAVGA